MAVGELLYEMKGDWNFVSIGNTPFGGRNNFELEGTVSGKLSGTFKGTDYGIGGSDGTIAVRAHETITTDDGQKISIYRQGYAVPNDKGTYDLLQFATFAADGKYAYLNSTVAALEGEGFPDKKPNLNLKAYVWKK